MIKSPLLLAFSLALVLAACGGGGGGGGTLPTGGGSTPTPVPKSTPTPTPKPTPTPTPTPTPGGSTALTGPASYKTGGPWGDPGVAQTLDFPVQHGFDGTGQTIAVVIDSDVSRPDVAAYFNYFQIPRSTANITTVAVPPAVIGPNGGLNGSQGEATLDVETVAGLAPGANVIIYQIASLSDQDIANGYNQILSDGKAYVVNSSFGGCENSGSPIDPVLAAGAQKGVAFAFSAGDSGDVCDSTATPAPGAVGAGWPASNPNVIGVGGTQTDNSQAQPLTSPVVWNDSVGSGGGGVSGLYTIPSYQTASLLASCLAAATGSPCSSTMRNEPDVSMPAVDVAIYLAGWHSLDGTSWSSPEYAALMAELYQYCNAATGVVNPVTIPYYVYGQSTADFIDVYAGNNQYKGATPFYAAATGFEDASGLGVPKGWAFAQTACPGRAPATGLSVVRTASVVRRSVEPYAMDVTPRVRGLIDEGVRGSNEATDIQIALAPTPGVATDEAAVITVLRSNGFEITRTFANHLLIDARGPSIAVERLFRTSMHNVMQGGYGNRYLATTQIMVPASLAPYVAGVSLDNLVTMHIPPLVH